MLATSGIMGFMRRLLLVATVGAMLTATTIPALAATRGAELHDNFFRPASLTVRSGDTLRFRWRGRARHNVTVTKGPQRFRSQTKASGSYRRRVTRRGSYRLVCTVHLGMRMSLRVR